MPHLKTIWLLAAGLFTQSLSAEESVAAAPAESPKLETSVRVIEQAGHESIRHACFALGPNKFAFVLPPGFRLDIATDEKVVLVNKDFTCLISLRVAAPATPEAQRAALLTRYPGAIILEELPLAVANQNGQMFDLQCSTGGVVRFARAAFIPSPAGVLEFILLSSPDKFREVQADFSFLLQTLRTSDATQELKVITFADQS